MILPVELTDLARREDIQLCLVVRAGSKSYGIDGPGSDDDCLGVFVSPLRRTISLAGPGLDTFTGNDPDFTLHEIGTSWSRTSGENG